MSQHRAFESEFRSIIASLPIRPDHLVLDLACGDGAFARWFAETGAHVLAIDISPAFLQVGRREVDPGVAPGHIRFVRGDLRRLPLAEGCFDFVWCAQSLYSLPDPLEALEAMRRMAKPGGVVAVIENDEFHHVLLPWPIEIELALRRAELSAHIERSRKPRKFYVGRQLLQLFHAAGLVECSQRTWTFDRQTPLEPDERTFFAHHLRDLRELTAPHLSPETLADFERLATPQSPSYLLNSEHFTATCLNYVICGKRPNLER